MKRIMNIQKMKETLRRKKRGAEPTPACEAVSYITEAVLRYKLPSGIRTEVRYL
jgi:hypothetical protein